jgi:hypothetical protein
LPEVVLDEPGQLERGQAGPLDPVAHRLAGHLGHGRRVGQRGPGDGERLRVPVPLVVDPPQCERPLDQRPDVPCERRAGRGLGRTLVDGGLVGDVVERDHGVDARCEVGRGDHHPGRVVHQQRILTGKRHGGGDRAVGDVVVPAVVVGELRDLDPRWHRAATAPASQHQQAPGIVGEDLAEVDLLAEELSGTDASPRRHGPG